MTKPIKTFYIRNVKVELSWMGIRLTGNNQQELDKIADYLFAEGFISENQMILFNIS